MLDTDILKNCENYDKIVNYNYNGEDFITEKIINIYQEQIFDKENQNIKKIKILDKIVMKYINDKGFYDFVRNYYLEDKTTYFSQEDLKLIELYDKYKLFSVQMLEQTKWI